MWNYRFILLATCCCFDISGEASAESLPLTLTCKEAQEECQISHTCGLHYHSVRIRCPPSPAAPNETRICTEDCQIALQNLEQGTKEGQLFTGCDCSSTDRLDLPHCQSHNALLACLPEKVEIGTFPTNGTSPVSSCNDARRYCETDWVCREALHYYEVICEQHFRDQPFPSGKERNCPASERCRETFDILMRQTFAKPLHSCRCDDLHSAPRAVYCFQVDTILNSRCEEGSWQQNGSPPIPVPWASFCWAISAILFSLSIPS